MKLKTNVFFIVFGLLSVGSFCQETIWFDANYTITTIEKATYYRPTPKEKRNNVLIIDYYKNGKKYREGKAKSVVLNNELFRGVVTYYYPNETIFKKITYKKGVIDGVYQEYYKTGELKESGRYNNGKKNGNWKLYNKSGKIKSKGTYRDGEKVGIWKIFYKNAY
ncbi:MAG: hypothetical protein GKR88_01310 [Flavobacteriaceae bacterium]|nr:MAG: hypothetical protein GKR88_01310 [Flavobacteriaceae bacterium]